MSSIVIAGDSSGSVTLQAPAVAGSTVLNLPSTSGTIQTSGAGYTTNGVAYATSTSALSTGSALTFDGSNLTLQATNTAVVFNNSSGTAAFQVGYIGGTNRLQGRGIVDAPMTFYVSDSEQMRLTSTGLGIGTSSPSYPLHVNATGNGTKARFTNGTTTLDLYCGGTEVYTGTAGSSTSWAYATANTYIAGYVNGTERARITSAGEFLLTGLTSPISSGILCIATNLNNNNPIVLKNTTTQGASQTFVVFLNSSNGQAGGIFHSGSTSVTYSTSSDARLKTDLGVAVSTNVIDNTIIHDYEWKEDKKIDRGVFAQEAYEVKPSAVAVGNDELTEDGNLAKPWGVDYSKYVPDLIVHAQQLKKQVQEQQALINTLTDRISVLENK